MIIKKHNKKNKINQDQDRKQHSQNNLELGNLHAAQVENISLWKVVFIFFIINLIIINIINYWQPINHKNVKDNYDKQQKAILSAYKLQHYINEFKINPDQNAFNIIQQAVSLNVDINKIKELNNNFDNQSAKNLGQNIEKIVASIPSIKIYQRNVDKAYKMVKNLKYTLISDLYNSKYDDFNKNLFLTTDKLESIVEQLKFEHWNSIELTNTYQKNVEDIGLEIEQHTNYVESNNLMERYKNIVNLMAEIFNELSSLMPEVFNLTEVTSQLNLVQEYQDKIITAIKDQEINYIENIDDKNIIIITILLTNFILLFIVIFVKASAKVKKTYNKIKNRKEIYYLSHLQEDSNNLAAVSHKVIEAKSEVKNIEQDFSELVGIQQQIINDSYIIQHIIKSLEKEENIYALTMNQLIIINNSIQRIINNTTLFDNYICKIKLTKENHAEDKLDKAV